VLFLALSYIPVLIACVWVCVSNASGRPLMSLTAVGIPYLLMTLTLVVLCLWPRIHELSLPASWLAGFTLTALAGLLFIVRSHPGVPHLSQLVTLFRLPSFRQFLGQLGSSVLENVGFLSNQLLLVFFFGLAGPGAISANNYAMRIGMLGYGMLTIPLAQLTQSRLCSATSDEERSRVFNRQLVAMATVVGLGAATLCLFRMQLASFIYLRGHFTASELHAVVELLPAWFSYFVVISLNAVASRLLFIRQQGMRYTRTMLVGYALANTIRMLTVGHGSSDWIVWAAVIGEGLAFVWNLQNCFSRPKIARPLYDAASPATA
jgi:peptidoglycan biosynthesis protein MviN/MurJ (putative lipid II flippase)